MLTTLVEGRGQDRAERKQRGFREKGARYKGKPSQEMLAYPKGMGIPLILSRELWQIYIMSLCFRIYFPLYFP